MPHGKICYLELPTRDLATSSRFYTEVFGWSTRTRADGTNAFDDSTGQVSGSFLTDRQPTSGDPYTTGIMIHIMVDDARATVDKITQFGGEIVLPIGQYAPTETVAIFRDPAGNILGIYQEHSHHTT